MGQLALASQQEPAELVLELLNRSRQRRLRNVAHLRRTREVQGLRHRQTIADLMHFHVGKLPRLAGWCKSQRRKRRAASGIGRAVAIAMAEADAAVAVNYVVSEDEARAVTDEIAGFGGR